MSCGAEEGDGQKKTRVEKLVEFFELIKRDIKKNKITVGLSNEKVLYRKKQLPRMRFGELERAIYWEKKELVNELGGEYVVDYEIIKANADFFEILMAAVPRNHVMDYLYAARESGLAIEAMDVYPLALSRVLKHTLPEKNFAVVDIGAARTEITLFEGGKVDFTCSVPAGGDDMTKLIAKRFSLDDSAAESMKINPGDCQNEIKECLTPLIHHLTLHVIRCVKYFERKKGSEVKAVVFTGGGGKLKGLKEYFFAQTGLEALLSSDLDFPYVELGSDIKGNFDWMEFFCAMGYALRGVF